MPLPVQSLLNRPTSSPRDNAGARQKNSIRGSCRIIVFETLCRDERHPSMPDTPAVIETDIPARLDRLPWSRFHTLVVVALGITWILDGLEVTLAGSIAGALQASPRLRFTASDIGLASSFYLAGAVIGALGFGWMTDRLGRRLLFFITLGL